MIFEEIGSDIPEKHLFCIENGAMLTDANLWQTHNQGYEPNYTFNYGFVNVGSIDIVNKRWLPLKGNIIEYWYLPADGIGCVELRANDNSYGIRQRLMDFATREYLDDLEIAGNAEGFYLITWKDRARLGDNGSEVGNAYSAYVTIGDPEESTQTIENKINDKTLVELASVDIANDALSQSQWRNRGMIVRVKRADEFNSQSAHIWLSFKNTNNSTFGTLITDVDVHPLTLTSDGHEIFPYEDTNDESLGFVDKRNTNCIAWIQAHDENDAPQMPKLHFDVWANGYTLSAKLDISYNRRTINYNGYAPIEGMPTKAELKESNEKVISKDFITFNSADWSSGIDTSWDISRINEPWANEIRDNGFFGGDAALTIAFIAQNEGDNDMLIECPYKFKFRIAGQNPDDEKCVDYLKKHLEDKYNLPVESRINRIKNIPPTKALYSMFWCIPAIAKHETYGYGGKVSSYYPYSVTFSDGTPFYNQFLASGDYYKSNYKNAGTPTIGEDTSGAGGYGIYQVTGDTEVGIYRAISRDQIWNWQKNIEGGMALLLDKFNDGVRWMDRQMNAQNANGNVPTYLAQNTATRTGDYKGNPYSVLISEETNISDKKMSHLSAIRLYNGRSLGTEQSGSIHEGKKDDDYNSVFVFNSSKYGKYCTYDNTSGKWYISRYNSNGKDYVDEVLAQVDSIKISDANPSK